MYESSGQAPSWRLQQQSWSDIPYPVCFPEQSHQCPLHKAALLFAMHPLHQHKQDLLTAATHAAWNSVSGRGMVAVESTGVCRSSPASTAVQKHQRAVLRHTGGCGMHGPPAVSNAAASLAAAEMAMAAKQQKAAAHPHALWAAPLP